MRIVNPIELSDSTIDTGVLASSSNRITNELTELSDRLALVESFSHVWVVRTAEGLVLFDTSGVGTAGSVLQSVRRWSDAQVHTIVYTHGHIDHVGGAHLWMAEAAERGRPAPRIVAHHGVIDRLDRYRRTTGYNLAIN